MAANVPNSGQFLQDIGTRLTALRDDFQRLVDKNDYVASMGGSSFLVNTLGMTQQDADALVATLGNHKNLSVHYNGGAQAPAMNYRANGQPFWGGN
jgi:hypothetical protein